MIATSSQTSSSVEARAQLRLLAVGLVLAMSPWFSTAAVAGQLRTAWDLSPSGLAWLVIAVQLGFVAGAALMTIAGLSDHIGPRRLILVGAAVAAAANGIIIVLPGLAWALPARFVTGAALAAVYPPAMKVMASWFVVGRGKALGVMIGALTIGSALPHLVNALGGLNWKATMLIASAFSLAGGLIAEFGASDGPHLGSPTRVRRSHVGEILRDRDFLLASAGYFGHMWELYAMWAWAAAFYGDVFASDRVASLSAFAVIAIGAAGSVYAGSLSDRISRPHAASLALRWSGSLAVVTGFLVDLPVLALIAGLVWGFWVVADSAQFSTVVTECIEPRLVGTALTMQLATGFVLTVFTIFLVPAVRDASSWGFAFLMLAPGPLLGAFAMRQLGRNKTN